MLSFCKINALPQTEGQHRQGQLHRAHVLPSKKPDCSAGDKQHKAGKCDCGSLYHPESACRAPNENKRAAESLKLPALRRYGEALFRAFRKLSHGEGRICFLKGSPKTVRETCGNNLLPAFRKLPHKGCLLRTV